MTHVRLNDAERTEITLRPGEMLLTDANIIEDRERRIAALQASYAAEIARRASSSGAVAHEIARNKRVQSTMLARRVCPVCHRRFEVTSSWRGKACSRKCSGKVGGQTRRRRVG